MNKDLSGNKTKVTFLPFLMKAAVQILNTMPDFNSSLNHSAETLIVKNILTLE